MNKRYGCPEPVLLHPVSFRGMTAAPPLFAIVCMDRRRGRYGERFRGLAFATEAEVHRWIDAAGDDVRRALVDGGYRVRPVADPDPSRLA
jgi:hypothetical protein